MLDTKFTYTITRSSMCTIGLSFNTARRLEKNTLRALVDNTKV